MNVRNCPFPLGEGIAVKLNKYSFVSQAEGL